MLGETLARQSGVEWLLSCNRASQLCLMMELSLGKILGKLKARFRHQLDIVKDSVLDEVARASYP